MTGHLTGFDDLQRQRRERDRHAENKGRLAVVQQQYTTTGQGVQEFEDRLDFGLTYVQKPWLSYGHELDPDDVRDLLELDPDEDIPYGLPQCTTYVTDWDQDEKGNYTGCWIAVSVLFPATYPADLAVTIVHLVSLSAVAIKDVPAALID